MQQVAQAAITQAVTLWATARLNAEGTGTVTLAGAFPYKTDEQGAAVAATHLKTLSAEEAAPVLAALQTLLEQNRPALELGALSDGFEAAKVAARRGEA